MPPRHRPKPVGLLLDHDLWARVRKLPEVQTLREFTSAALVRLDQLRGELEPQAVTPDSALDELRTMRDQLTGHLDRLAAAVANTYAGSRRRTMRDAMTAERRKKRREPTIISTAHPGYSWYGVPSFVAGYSLGTTRVEQASSSSSSSGGSTSGYTPSSGGNFTGAGNSSRF